MAELPRDPSLELGSIFLGPKAENAELLERLLLEALRDHVFWRRNVHPEDGFSILESDKRSPAFERSASLLSQEGRLFSLASSRAACRSSRRATSATCAPT